MKTLRFVVSGVFVLIGIYYIINGIDAYRHRLIWAYEGDGGKFSARGPMSETLIGACTIILGISYTFSKREKRTELPPNEK
jgi:hypothetical protein